MAITLLVAIVYMLVIQQTVIGKLLYFKVVRKVTLTEKSRRYDETVPALEKSVSIVPKVDAAIVTLAGGDASGRHLVSLLQSLRDVNTTLPVVILLARGGLGSAACHDSAWKRANNRTVDCTGPDTIGRHCMYTAHASRLKSASV